MTFPSGRHADELCVTELAQVVWAANLAVIDFHPWPSRRKDTEHPDEPHRHRPAARHDVQGRQACRSARARGARGDRLRRLAEDLREPRRARLLPHRAQLGVPGRTARGARLRAEVERRLPKKVTTAWWKEERGKRVFIDYNQNARDRTVASAYSVRARPDAAVSAPVSWDELPDVETEDFTMSTVPERFAKLGDIQAGMDDAVCDLRVLLEWVEREEKDGVGEAPYPPNFPKMPGEPPRVQPSRARKRD